MLATTCLTPDCTPAVHDLGVLAHAHTPGHGLVVNPKAGLHKIRVLPTTLPIDL